jgi:hypothetical protein
MLELCNKLYKEVYEACSRIMKDLFKIYVWSLFGTNFYGLIFLSQKKLFSFDFLELSVLIFAPVKTIHLFLAYASCFCLCESCRSFPNSFARISNRSLAHAHTHDYSLHTSWQVTQSWNMLLPLTAKSANYYITQKDADDKAQTIKMFLPLYFLRPILHVTCKLFLQIRWAESICCRSVLCK